MKIVNGMRPKIVPGTPLEYRKLIEQCWDAELEKRPDIYLIRKEISELTRLYYLQSEKQKNSNQGLSNSVIDNSS